MKDLSVQGAIEVTSTSKMFVLSILDDQLCELAISNGGNLSLQVPPGLYIARCEAGGPAAQKTVRVTSGGTQKVHFDAKDLPRMNSSAPVIGAENNHEYFRLHARELSVAPQADASWNSNESRLIVMNRRLREGAECMAHLNGFQLLTHEGKFVTRFVRDPSRLGEDQRRREDESFGRYAFSIDLPPGGYILKWPSGYRLFEPRVCFPVWIAAGWCTRVYLGVNDGEKYPAPSSVSVHMGKLGEEGQMNFQREDTRTTESTPPVGTATELALASLRTGRRQLSDAMLDELLQNKFSNPMSGILGAYMLCQRDKPNWDLFSRVYRALSVEIPGHPDLAGLAALAYKHVTSIPFPREPVEFPPMVRIGSKALSEQDWSDSLSEGLVADGSLAELARLQSFGGGVWTIFTLPTARRSSAGQATAELERPPESETNSKKTLPQMRRPLMAETKAVAFSTARRAPSSGTPKLAERILRMIGDTVDKTETGLREWEVAASKQAFRNNSLRAKFTQTPAQSKQSKLIQYRQLGFSRRTATKILTSGQP